MGTFTIKVNGRAQTVEADTATPLLYVLSDEIGLRGPKFGCGLGQCGACTVILGDTAVRSCLTPVGGVGTAEITTLEGLGTSLQAASAAAGLHRRAGGAVRLLSERRDPHGEGAARSQSASERREIRKGLTASCAAASRTLECCARSGATRAGSRDEAHGRRAAALERTRVTRRDLLKSAAGLVVAFSSLGAATRLALAQGGAGSNALDAWLAVDASGHVTAYTGKCELGQGIFTAQAQLVAEELCVPLEAVTLIQCDTARTPDQGTTSGSQSHPTNFNGAISRWPRRPRASGSSTSRQRISAAARQLVASDGIVERPDGAGTARELRGTDRRENSSS